MKICLIDNYDSFTYNLEHQLRSFDLTVDVVRNDETSIEALTANAYDAFVIGPGPSNPKNAGISIELIKHFYKTTPILGICLGMQILFNHSYEIKKTEGLRLLDGEVKKLNNNQKKTILKLPHIGWNNLNISDSDPILKNITKKDYFYFIHNYAVCNTGEQVKFTTTTYEQINFPALTWKKNIYGCQFHPEKSATSGLKLLENFINLN